MNFIVTCVNRSGSTMLIKYLSEQKNIKCYHSIYGKHNDTNFKKTNPVEYMKEFSLKSKKKYTGFKITFKDIKILLKHNFDLLTYCKENNIKIILLERKNKFLRELSSQTLKAIRQIEFVKDNNTAESYNKTLPKYNFDLVRYKNNTVKQIAQYKEIENIINYKQISYIKVYYENLTSDSYLDSFKEIVEFIDKDEQNFKPLNIKNDLSVKKRNIYSIEEHLLNYEEVCQDLKEDIYFQEALDLDKRRLFLTAT